MSIKSHEEQVLKMTVRREGEEGRGWKMKMKMKMVVRKGGRRRGEQTVRSASETERVSERMANFD